MKTREEDELLKYRLDYKSERKQHFEAIHQNKIADCKSKTCPLKFAATTENGYPDYVGYNCDADKCAWFIEAEYKCSVTSLAYLEDIAIMAKTYNQIHQ